MASHHEKAETTLQARRRAEEQLRQHSELLRVTLSCVGDALISTDTEGRVLFMNGVAESLTGWTQEEALERLLPEVFRVVHEHSREPLENSTLRALREGVGVELANQALLISKDGTARPIDERAAPIRADSGGVLGAVLVFRDISVRLRAEQALRDMEQRFRLMADVAPVLIWSSGPDKLRTWFNRLWLEFVGRPMEMEIGDGWSENVHPDDLQTCLNTYRLEFDERRPFRIEYRLRRHDGEYRWLLDSGTPRDEPDGTFAGYIGSCVDITERKQAEEALGWLAAIIESSHDAIYARGLDGSITSWNQSAERMFGYTTEEAVKQHSSFIVPPDRLAEDEEVLRRVRNGERVDHFETERVAKGGRRVNVSIAVSPVKDATGRVIGVSKVARDITERRREDAEREALLASERMARADAERANRLKEEFLATLSHELRTPLHGILGWTQLLKGTDHTHETIDHGIEVIDRCARMQAQLIADLLDMSRIISGKMRLEVQRVDLSAVIDGALDSMRPAAEAKEVTIVRSIEPLDGPVYGDPARLQQVVWNLLSNAVKFTPQHGRIEVRLAKVDSHFEISVTDTGKGITRDFLPHVFERFRQADSSVARQFGGLGLGLAIVKQLVELHGGTVRVTSEGEDKGSCFTVQIPLASSNRFLDDDAKSHSRTTTLPPWTSGSPDLEGIRVLVVDDEDDARELLQRVLENTGAQVVLARSVNEALASMKLRMPDVILSDIGMPDIDGYAFIRAVRAKGIQVPAAALTAFARSEDRERALQAGFQSHISKPVETTKLVATVASLARLSRQLDGTAGNASA